MQVSTKIKQTKNETMGQIKITCQILCEYESRRRATLALVLVSVKDAALDLCDAVAREQCHPLDCLVKTWPSG